MKVSKQAFALALLSFLCIQNVLGMFEAVLTHGESLYKNNDKWNLDNLKVKRYNRTAFAITGTFDIFIDYADDCDIYCISYKKAGNDYKLLPYKFGPKNLCSFVKEEEMFYPMFHSVTKNFPPLKECGFKKGNYVIDHYMPDLSKVPPVFESGDYMVECQAMKDDQIINGYKAYTQVHNYASAKPAPSFKP